MSKEKDPAVLWYYRDYLSGTEEMTWAQQGAYSRLLNKQADKGHLSIDSIRKVLRKDFEKLWPGIKEKFLVDAEGNFYNDRMDREVTKRAKNSQAQRDRIQKYWDEQRNNHGNTAEYTTEVPIANADASEEEVVLKEGGTGETKPLPSYGTWAQEKQNFFDDGGWQIKFTSHKGISLDDLQKLMQEFIIDIELKQDFKVKKELQSHFTNLFNKQKNGRTEQRSRPAGKQGTSEARTDTASKW